MKINKMVQRTIEPVQLIQLRVKWKTLERLDSWMQKHDRENRTEVLNELITLALDIMDKVESVPSTKWNEHIDELKSQRKQGGLIDYIERIPVSEVKLLYDIIQEEYKRRGLK